MSVQTMLEHAGLSPEQAARRILELELEAYGRSESGRIKQRDTVPRRDPAKKKAQRKAARAARKRQRR